MLLATIVKFIVDYQSRGPFELHSFRLRKRRVLWTVSTCLEEKTRVPTASSSADAAPVAPGPAL
jgi:hypothetical protein